MRIFAKRCYLMDSLRFPTSIPEMVLVALMRAATILFIASIPEVVSQFRLTSSNYEYTWLYTYTRNVDKLIVIMKYQRNERNIRIVYNLRKELFNFVLFLHLPDLKSISQFECHKKESCTLN